MWRKYWLDTNGGCKNRQKNHEMTDFKFVKKLSSECWFLKSEWSISNGAPTHGFIRHLPLFRKKK